MSSILESEQYIDTCTDAFVEKLDSFSKSGDVVDLGAWLQMYAFDVLGELYFGKAFGFIATSSDFNNWIEALDQLLPVLCINALLPAMYRVPHLLSGLFFRSVRTALKNVESVAKLARAKVKERQDLLENADSGEPLRRDMLAKLFTLKNTKGEEHDFKVPDIEQESWVVIFAGSDTTAVAMRAVVDQLLRNSYEMDTLRAELDGALSSGKITVPTKYSDIIANLPYFKACVKEAMRLHPSVGLQLPRHVPAGGCELAGHYIAPGVRVGVNAAVLHYDTSIFGPDAASFNPGRWLESGSGQMDKYMLTFGGGARTCIGKNISLAEIHKLLPQLFLRYDFSLTNPGRALRTHDFWFNKQGGLSVKVSRRKSA